MNGNELSGYLGPKLGHSSVLMSVAGAVVGSMGGCGFPRSENEVVSFTYRESGRVLHILRHSDNQVVFSRYFECGL